MKNENLKRIGLQYFGDEGNDKDKQNKNQDQDQNAGNEGDQEEKKEYTIKEIQAMMAKEKKQGKSSGRTELLKELGIENIDTFKENMKKFNEYQENQKTELDKAKDDVIKANNEKANAESRAKIAEAKVEAMKKGVNPEFVDDVITLALSKKQDGEELSDVIEGMKETHKMFFGTQNNDGTGNNPTGKKSGGKVEGIGAQLGKARNEQGKKQSSYFRN